MTRLLKSIFDRCFPSVTFSLDYDPAASAPAPTPPDTVTTKVLVDFSLSVGRYIPLSLRIEEHTPAPPLRVAMSSRDVWNAVASGDTKTLKQQLDQGAHPDSSALYAAAIHRHTDAVRLLIDRGTPLDPEALAGAARAARSTPSRFCSSVAPTFTPEMTSPLREAAWWGHTDTVKPLLDRGADIHAEGDSALELAAESGLNDLAALLIERGAYVHARDSRALETAAAKGRTTHCKQPCPTATPPPHRCCATHSSRKSSPRNRGGSREPDPRRLSHQHQGSARKPRRSLPNMAAKRRGSQRCDRIRRLHDNAAQRRSRPPPARCAFAQRRRTQRPQRRPRPLSDLFADRLRRIAPRPRRRRQNWPGPPRTAKQPTGSATRRQNHETVQIMC